MQNETQWRISWSPGLTPAAQMVPDDSVFFYAPQTRSLTATTAAIPGSLGCPPEHVWNAAAPDSAVKKEKKKGRGGKGEGRGKRTRVRTKALVTLQR